MRYDEQQINNSLQCLEEQEELNSLRFEMARSNQMLQLRLKQSDISEWGEPKQYQSQGKKKSKFPYLKSTKQTQKRYTYFLDSVNESQDQNFFQYAKLPPYRIQKSCDKLAPRKIDLELPRPLIVQEGADRPVYQSEVSLPLIKKIAFPVKLLRRDERQKLRKQDLFKLEDLSGFLGIGGEDGSSKRGKMLTTRRQLKSFQSFTERSQRSSLDDNKLKQCITFIK